MTPGRRSLLSGCVLLAALAWLLGAVTATGARPPATLPEAAIVGSAVLAPALNDPIDPYAGETLRDPVPLRRVLLSTDRLDSVVGSGNGPRAAMRRLPQEEFEAKVRLAAREQIAAKNPPRIVEANYRAAWVAGRLGGTGDWQLVCPSRHPAPLSLEPLQLAIGPPTWADGRPVKVFRGTMPGRAQPSACLWADDPNGGRISFPWSVRGIEEPDEERFELSVPAAPVAVLVLTLPVDRVASSSTPGVFLSGPFPGEKAEERRWRLSFGGQARLDVAVRRSVASEGTPVVAQSRTARYRISPGEVSAVFDLRLESFRGPVRERVFSVDPGLRVMEVSGDQRENWRFEPGPTPQTPGTLHVNTREAQRVTNLIVTAVAPLPYGNITWGCPSLRAVGGLPGPEAIDVVVAPEIKLDGWTAGDFRPSATERLPDRAVRLSFVGTLPTNPADDRIDRRRPTIRLRGSGIDLATEEMLIWRLEPGRNRLSARVKIRVLAGPVSAFTLQTTPGYIIDSVDALPDDAGVMWSQVPGPQTTWQIEPSRAAATGDTIDLRLELRGPPLPAAVDPAVELAGVFVPYPKFTLTAAVERLGTLVVRPAGVRVSVPTGTPGTPTSTEYSLPYRGREPDGEVLVLPDRLTATARTESVLILDNVGYVLRSTVAVDVDPGARALTVYVPPGGDLRCDIGTAHIERFLSGNALASFSLFSGQDGWSALAGVGVTACYPGSFWRVAFPAPTRGPIVLRSTIRLPPAPAAQGLTLPLPVVGGSNRLPMKLTLATEAAERFDPPDPRELLAPTFPVSLRLQPRGTRPQEPTGGQPWRFADLSLHAAVEADTSLTYRFSGRISQRPGTLLSIRLPNEARLHTALIGGKLLDHPRLVGNRLDLPLPSGAGHTFEIIYQMPAASGSWWIKSPLLLPELPGEPVAIDTTWEVASARMAWPALDTGEVAASVTDLRTVDASVVLGLGYLFAALFFGLVVATLTTTRRWPLLLLMILVTLFGSVLWLAPPGWSALCKPAVIIGGIGLALNVRGLRSNRTPPESESTRSGPKSGSRKQGIVLANAALLTLGISAGTAQSPEPATVYLVPAGKAAADRFNVVAPIALLDRLDQLGRPALPAVMLTAAEFDGAATSSGVNFDARFTIDCTSAEEQTFLLPLAGVRLESANLDGENAYPDASRPERFGIVIRGVGRHELSLRFAVSPVATGAEREVRFAVPNTPVCRVAFSAGLRGRQVDVPTRRGGQTIRITTNGLRADADHGGGNEVVVRWREGAAEGSKAAISVREACIWDISEAETRLTSALVYRIEGGTVTQLQLEMPEGMEPGQLRVRPLDPRAAGVGVRDWRIGTPVKGWVPVSIRLQGPTDGRLVVLLTCYPRRQPSLRPILRFPRAADVADIDSFYALRYSGVSPDTISMHGVIDFPLDAMVKEFAAIPELGLDKSPPARVVRRIPLATPDLRPLLLPVPTFTANATETLFTIGRRIEIEGAVKAASAITGVVEFDISQAVKIHEVRAAGLAGWGRTGSRVQVWLNQPVPEVQIRWSGTLANDLAPGGRPSSSPVHLDLPLPRPASPTPLPTEAQIVRLRPQEGWTLTALPSPAVTIRQAPATLGEQVFAVRPESNPPPLKILVGRSNKPLVEAGTRPARATAPTTTSTSSASAPAAVDTTAEADTPAVEGGGARWIWGSLWLLACVALGMSMVRGSQFWWPERSLAWALLCAITVGFASNAIWLFVLVAAVAGSVSVWRLTRRALKLVVR